MASARSPRTSPSGERKQVTVLFADVQGSMDLAEEQDPEQWRKIMQRFFSILADAVQRFEGTVDKFTGDGIMAVFGAPVAHEDHARRACYAALQMLDDVAEYAAELRRRHGLNFSTRIGINSGEVVAGAIGDGGEGEYTAIGHTVGLAQRMEALAEPGKAYLTESTRPSWPRGFLELEDLGEFEIKGASRPVGVFELAGVGAARSRLDLSRERGFSRFVGRDEEMEVLEEALARPRRARARRSGSSPKPGVGKSRLCHEFAERCRERGIEVFEARPRRTGSRSPSCRCCRCCAPTSASPTATRSGSSREKIAGRALLLDPELAEDLPLLFDFLGVPDPDRPLPQMSPEARQRALRGVVCHLISAPTAATRRPRGRGPALDGRGRAHAARRDGRLGRGNPTLACQLPARILARAGAARRSTAGSRWSRWGRRTPELLRDLAGEDPSLDGLAEPIHERTGGNPFFVEEIVRELVEAGTSRASAAPTGWSARSRKRACRPPCRPCSRRASTARPDAKQLLQATSVVGKEMSAAGAEADRGAERRGGWTGRSAS